VNLVYSILNHLNLLFLECSRLLVCATQFYYLVLIPCNTLEKLVNSCLQS
jgi:hypothetical protein